MIDDQEKVDVKQNHYLSEGKVSAVECKKTEDASSGSEDEIIEERGSLLCVKVCEKWSPLVDELLLLEPF